MVKYTILCTQVGGTCMLGLAIGGMNCFGLFTSYCLRALCLIIQSDWHVMAGAPLPPSKLSLLSPLSCFWLVEHAARRARTRSLRSSCVWTCTELRWCCQRCTMRTPQAASWCVLLLPQLGWLHAIKLAGAVACALFCLRCTAPFPRRQSCILCRAMGVDHLMLSGTPWV